MKIRHRVKALEKRATPKDDRVFVFFSTDDPNKVMHNGTEITRAEMADIEAANPNATHIHVVFASEVMEQ